MKKLIFWFPIITVILGYFWFLGFEKPLCQDLNLTISRGVVDFANDQKRTIWIFGSRDENEYYSFNLTTYDFGGKIHRMYISKSGYWKGHSVINRIIGDFSKKPKYDMKSSSNGNRYILYYFRFGDMDDAMIHDWKHFNDVIFDVCNYKFTMDHEIHSTCFRCPIFINHYGCYDYEGTDDYMCCNECPSLL